MTVEQRLDQLERRNKRLTVALTMMAVTMAAVVTMAATGLKDGHFDTVTARKILVKNGAGHIVVSVSTDEWGKSTVEAQTISLVATARRLALAHYLRRSVSRGLRRISRSASPWFCRA